MQIGLVDLYFEGHHLPYAHGIKRALEAASSHEITFITLTATQRGESLFSEDEIVYLDEPTATPIEERNDFSGAAEEAVREVFTDIVDDYEVIHFLYTDDILGQLWRNRPSDGTSRIVGELNGNFFRRAMPLRRRYLHPMVLWSLKSPAGGLIDKLLPDRTEHQTVWRDLYLYRCLRSRTLDHIVVHSPEAHEYVGELDTRDATPRTVVPYPAPESFGSDISRAEARERLDLPPEERILLFFGSLRREKGIDLLLEAVRRYRGPQFTLVIAGPPTAVEESEVQDAARESPIKLITRLKFIDSPEVYYRASDALVLPYRRKYGRERASQMFDEACSAGRPVIVPDFGVLGRLAKEWGLGVTFTEGSADSLAARIEDFARDGIESSGSRRDEYMEKHSYERIAPQLLEIYEG